MAVDPSKTIKILCVCQKGYTRSLGTVYRLNRRGYGNVIAAGEHSASPHTMKMLSEWADVILLAMPHMERVIPEAMKPKIEKRFEIGEDRWGWWRHAELQQIIRTQLNQLGFR